SDELLVLHLDAFDEFHLFLLSWTGGIAGIQDWLSGRKEKKPGTQHQQYVCFIKIAKMRNVKHTLFPTSEEEQDFATSWLKRP
ncbi:hypothetical protein AB6W56_27850, partial [Klebsiella pneumoniae]|uniref:hypothetical protein n=1 Tax=Klebsiella pneumoniae TaxID=573 RepID=UPI0034E2638C